MALSFIASHVSVTSFIRRCVVNSTFIRHLQSQRKYFPSVITSCFKNKATFVKVSPRKFEIKGIYSKSIDTGTRHKFLVSQRCLQNSVNYLICSFLRLKVGGYKPLTIKQNAIHIRCHI